MENYTWTVGYIINITIMVNKEITCTKIFVNIAETFLKLNTVLRPLWAKENIRRSNIKE